MRYKSVFLGKDYQIIPILLELHCNTKTPLILDCTYNTGKIWKKLNYNILKMDINSNLKLDVIADFQQMPFKAQTFDVIVFDPPFLPRNAASKNSSRIYEKTYGITENNPNQDNVSSYFQPFLIEAQRVLKKNGIILTKLADLVHNHRYQWQQVMFINEVQKTNMTPCDMMIKCDPAGGNLSSSKWKNVKHLRKSHAYWIVVRNSKNCENHN